MKLIAALALTLAIASATSVPFQTCGSNNHATISSIDASPYPPVKGKALTVEAKGSLDEQLTSGKYTIEVQLFGITLLKKTGDICTLDPSKFSCPHDKGDITVSDTVTIPGIAPSGTYSIKLSSTDQNGDSLLCVQLSVKIGDGEFVVSDAAPAQSQDMIDMINRFPGNTWTAGYSERFQGMTMEHVKGLCGAFPESDDVRLPVREIEVAEAIPAEFDSRTQWGDKCPSTKEIRDQGSCGSCWAVSSAETMTDRLCIASNGADQTYLSAEDIMSCCGFSCGSGCDGGYPSGAFQYFEYSGVVSGGPYNSKQGCLPYEIASCEHHTTGSRPPCGSIEPTPSCTKQCQNGKQWSAAKHFGASSYSVPSDVASIQTEIMTNGPVTAAFSVYSDFPSYKSGVYQHTSGGMLGGHAVKIIGWGTENGSPYWLVANSWNTDWADLGGYFKILRGVDECGIESSIVAGMPKV